MILADRRLLITGVITRGSIAFEVARRAQLAGAEIVLTGFGRARRMTERAAKGAPDAGRRARARRQRAGRPRRRWPRRSTSAGRASTACSTPSPSPPRTRSAGPSSRRRPRARSIAFKTSAFSLKALAVAVLPLLERAEDGASIVGLDFDASVAWPAYDWMGVAKAALESVSRYLARDLGPRGHPRRT